jgi:hypothetical protein
VFRDQRAACVARPDTHYSARIVFIKERKAATAGCCFDQDQERRAVSLIGNARSGNVIRTANRAAYTSKKPANISPSREHGKSVFAHLKSIPKSVYFSPVLA